MGSPSVSKEFRLFSLASFLAYAMEIFFLPTLAPIPLLYKNNSGRFMSTFAWTFAFSPRSVWTRESVTQLLFVHYRSSRPRAYRLGVIPDALTLQLVAFVEYHTQSPIVSFIYPPWLTQLSHSDTVFHGTTYPPLFDLVFPPGFLFPRERRCFFPFRGSR